MNFTATPRKRPAPGEPGSTPFSSSKFQSSLVSKNKPTPSRSYHPAKNKSKPTGFSSNTRDIFRTSTPQSNRVSTFSPDLPPVVKKATPTARKFVPAKSVGAGMSSAASADLFKMRIPSPDPELTGETLSKQVPNDPNRTGTIYADQYLAHKCPPQFDELQRRQFFCILDLRRLKFAANEIFAKKDWKLNILNFAKEYEKSRGLILLRYGLYEFKKVKPSAEVLKRWRAAHGLPDEPSEDKATETNGANGAVRPPGTATKRKADDDVGVKSNVPSAFSASPSKRRNVDQEATDPISSGPAPFKKSKRKADETDELEESQPSKQQKQPTSAAKSMFESILDKAQSSTSSPLKGPALGSTTPPTPFGAQKSDSQKTESTPKSNPFGVQKSDSQKTESAPKSNPFGASSSVSQSSSSFLGTKPTTETNFAETSFSDSILAKHKPGTPLTTNTGIFSYLSSANTSGNEKEDADEEESESGSEQGAEDAAPSYEPSAAASTGTNTPPVQNGAPMFGSNKFGSTNNGANDIFNKPATTPAKGGLFDRVSKGADGQPLRAPPRPTVEDAPETSASEASTPAPEPTKTQPKTPGDYRFDPTTTPISFGQSNAASTAAKPQSFAAAAPVPVTPKDPFKSDNAPALAKTSSAFGSTNEGGSTTPATAAPKSLFGGTSNASSIFQAKPSESTGSLFGVKKSIETPDEPSTSPTKSTFGSILGSKPESTKPATLDQTKSPFGAASVTSTPGIFGKPAEPQSTTANDQSKNYFGAASLNSTPAESQSTTANNPSKNFFGADSATSTPVSFGKQTESQSTVSKDQKPLFGTPSANPTTSFFGKPAEAQGAASNDKSNNMFGAPSTSTSGTANMFHKPAESQSSAAGGSQLFQGGKRGFDDTSKRNELEGSQPMAKKAMFGSEKPATTNLFGANAINGSASAAGFGTANNQPTAGPIFNSFKSETTNGTQGASNIFSSPSTTSTLASNASIPATTSFSFTAGAPASTEQKPNGAMDTSNLFGNNAGISGSSFEFKASSPARSPGPSTSNKSGRKIATPRRRLGTPGATGSQTPNTSFNAPAPQPQANASFSFGSNNPGPASTTTSFGGETTNGGFNFTFGGNGQSNPFGTPGQASAPQFGNNPTTPAPATPFGSFEQKSFTPAAAPPSQIFGGMSNGTNAAPSFNFQGATPQQNATSIFAQKPLFGNNLQPGGDGTTGASSPMPAPSSLGTTPANGTPEPQAQNEDGEEAPQAQISLTEGGPGEENEETLHEVRAKAIKYVPVSQGEEGEKSASPWRTQGIGPLRILKSKTTGSVRILLRAEPRGHIAMNKAILPDIEYKAKEKTINFATASDSGSGLETWVLQLKTPEFAQELASMMEKNKVANKK